MNSILPDSPVLSDFTTLPLGSIRAEIPLLADLAIKTPSSTDLYTAFVKCWYGPIDCPNQASSEIFIIKSKSELSNNLPE